MMSLSILERDVNKLFKRQNSHKAAGPDSVSPSTLKHCVNQLSLVFTDIVNTSLETCHIPACFKTSTIIPIPKNKDHRTQANKSVDNAVNLALHFILQHLDSAGTYARILFVDFSSSFSTIILALLQDKLSHLPFTIHYKCVTGSRRVERGEQCVVTLSTALQLSAWLQLLLPAGRGGPGRRPSARLPPPPSPPHTTTTTRINRSATPYKRSTEVHASQYSAPPTMTSHVVQD
eukprot:superscaffoldBa00000392_g4348